MALATFLLSALLCGVYIRFARARQLLAVPTERSSHSQPTPNGGGMALLLAFAAGLVAAVPIYGGWGGAFITLASAALVLALLGFIDDQRGLSVGLRLLLYGAVCLGLAALLLKDVAGPRWFAGVTVVVLVALAMLWMLNLYNFMDGIDGIAALQTILACGAAAAMSWQSTGDNDYALFCVLMAAAHAGFLVWNLPLARLFMGDAGSVATGALLAGLALVAAVQGQINPLCWLVLLAVFITDTTWTLLWRIWTGQAFTQPHRLHAYQRLSRLWGSHLKVDVLLLAINLLWLIPLAWALEYWPKHALILVFLAYLPLVCGMAKIRRLT